MDLFVSERSLRATAERCVNPEMELISPLNQSRYRQLLCQLAVGPQLNIDMLGWPVDIATEDSRIEHKEY